MHKTKLNNLRNSLKKQKLSGFVVPSNDEFQSEFCPEHARRLQWLTGFTGSMGIAVVLEKKAAFFTDGRYTLQATQQVSKDYEHYNIADKKPHEWINENLTKGKLGLDPWLHTQNSARQYMDVADIVLCKSNPIDSLWENRPEAPNSNVKSYPLKYAGEKSTDKIKKITASMKKQKIDACILAAPDSICWLLNIRAGDIPTTPFLLAYAILHQNGTVKLFVDKKRITKKLDKNVKIHAPSELEKELKALTKKNISLDPAIVPYWFFEKLKKQNIIRKSDPCQLPKACKNAVEVKGTHDSHITDGVAVTRFLHWLDTNLGKGRITEMSAAKKLYNLRRENPACKGVSFDTIAGFASNGAIVHYRSVEETNKEIKGNSLFLVDSGGQYYGGTTDITRTIAIGKPTKEQKRNFTLVLKGHIALACAVFAEGTSGSQLDTLARQYLWADGLDYDHGTGHGVGSYLSVHEGPQRISKIPNNVALRPGMIISNEPGYYKEGEYGIRIESLVVVIKRDDLNKGGRNFYGFETITKVPIDMRLVDKTMLTTDEKKWLTDYHKQVKSELAPLLPKDVKAWLGKCAI